jgi:hypothetical protein
MTKRGLASSAVAIALLASKMASAQEQLVPQADSPQWLKDRRFTEGAGVRTGDLEVHPGIAGEFGYDSNWFTRSDKQGVDNGPPRAPVLPALLLRITPSLYLSTLGPQRREEEGGAALPSIRFRAGVNATYREYIGLSNDPVVSSDPQNNDISKQRSLGGAADARLEILPERPVGAVLFASYARSIQPNVASADPNLSFIRDDVGAGGEIVAQPGSGTLDWHFGYQLHDAIFESSLGQPYDNFTNEAYTRGRWKFRPRTALIYDATFRFISYGNAGPAAGLGLANSTPVRTRIGINGLVTERFAALALVGWGASFFDTSLLPQLPQYDSVIGQAELKWFLTASPGISAASQLTLALSSISVGYTRDFANSYLGNFYGSDRGYLRFEYFFGGRAVLSLQGGLGAIEYPKMFWGSGQPRDIRSSGGTITHDPFTDLRADATLFGEYRLSDSFGINATLRYTANFSDKQIQDSPPGTVVPPSFFDLSWTRFEAFLGARWFL